MAFTVVKKPFGTWVKQQIEDRNQRLTVDKQLNIELDPELAAAFNASTAISTQKGIGANLLKIGMKRRRTKAQVDEDREEAELKEESLRMAGQQS